jgi:hypothetical protein
VSDRAAWTEAKWPRWWQPILCYRALKVHWMLGDWWIDAYILHLKYERQTGQLCDLHAAEHAPVGPECPMTEND